MAEATPPRRRPFMNRAVDSQPRQTAVKPASMKRSIILAIGLLCSAGTPVRAVKIEHKSLALDFTYGWPSEAAAISPLDWRLRDQMAKAYRDALANAHEDQAVAREQKRPYNQHFFSMEWSTAGETPRLLSLQSELSTFTGGAHPNTSYNALLWDRRTSQQISFSALLTGRANIASLMRSDYCKALDAERLKRRQGEKLGGVFDECPKLSDLAIALADQDKNGRFDMIAFVASPYVAGPYAEGEYDISLPVTARFIAALKPAYRGSFEAQRQ